GLAVAGCDSGSSCADGGVCDGGLGGAGGGAGGAGGAAGPFSLTGGTYCFDVTGVAGIVDGCGITPQVVTKLPVSYVGGVVAVGRMGSVGQGALGNNNMATLMRVGATGDGAACTWNQTDTSTMTLTANNEFTISVSETESTFAATCVPPPPSDPCTSTWTWTMKIHVPATMPSAVTGDCE
ncbi:MAG TPA: hypothetical protein VHU40_10905, partial [Polyangia bacterium]|nr:hypothetical protein [Polyangia bacterium]